MILMKIWRKKIFLNYPFHVLVGGGAGGPNAEDKE